MAELNIVVTAQDQATHVLRGIGGITHGIFSGIASAATQMLASAVGGAFDSIKNAMIGGNAEFERYETQFSVLMRSAEGAKERLAELAEFGVKTPFELPEVVRADKILQAFGFHSAEAAQRFGMSGAEIRTIAGDMAAGSGAAFEEIADYLGRFASGSTGFAIAQFQRLGIVTREELSKMGVEFSKAGELVSPVDDAMKILLARVKEKFGGMMEAQSSTFEGMMSNFQDWLGAAGRTLGAPLFDIAKQGLFKLLERLNEFTPVLKEIAQQFGFFLQALTAGDVEGAFTALYESFDILSAAFPNLAGSINAVQKAFGDVWNAVTAIDFSPLIAAISELLDVMGIEFPSAGDVVVSVSRGITVAVQGIAQFLNTTLIPALTAVVRWVIANWPQIRETVQNVMTTVTAVLQAVIQFVQTVLIPALQSVVAWVVANWPHIYATIQSVMQSVQTAIQTVLSAIQAFWQRWGGDIMAVVNWLRDQLMSWVNVFSLAFQGRWYEMGEELRRIFDRSVAAIIEIAKRIGAWFTSQDWGAIGRSILEGISRGIQAAARGLAEAAIAAARAALEAVRGFLGIKSPSVVFAGVGRDMMQGMARGIRDATPQPVSAARAAASTTVTNIYQLSVTSARSAESVVQDFWLMRAALP